MNKEEIVKFLKENLHIVIKENTGGCSCCYGPDSIEISIKLGEEEISSDSFYLPHKS